MGPPAMNRRPSSNPRVFKIWFSLAATAAGLALLTLLAVALARQRETDLRDSSGSVTRAAEQAIPPDAPRLELRDRAAELGIRMRHGPGRRSRNLPEDTGSGLAWGDYDGDGDFDLYLVNFPASLGAAADPAGGNRLFRNDGGRFVEVSAAAGVEDLDGFGMGASFADYDGDGDLDLYVTNYGPNRLFRNRGDGRFEEVGAWAGVDDALWSVGAAWGDYDRDGRLDLYVTNYLDFHPEPSGAAGDDPHWQGVPISLNPNAFDPQPNRLYHQLADHRFEEVALPLGASNNTGRSLQASFVDFDGDGWLDLYVANDVSPDALLRNLGGEVGAALFEDVSAACGTADSRGSMGISVADLAAPSAPGDGLPDFFVTHWVAQENALFQAVRSPGGAIEHRDRARAWGLGEISLERVGWGSAFVDLDNDGRLDLVVANGSTLEERSGEPPGLIAQPLFLFWNAGDHFVDLAPLAAAAGRPYNARGLAAADFDGDGDVDLAVSINRGEPLLLCQESRGAAHWLGVRLSGSPAAAAGARLTLTTAAGRQTVWWGADASFASGHAAERLFGLPRGASAAALEVHWVGGDRRLLRLPPAARYVVPLG